MRHIPTLCRRELGAYFLSPMAFLILLACPLMHLFMHHGHGGHGKNDDASRTQAAHNPGAHNDA